MTVISLRRTICAAGLLIALLSVTQPVLAQPFVPVESYNRTRPDFGNTLPLCVIPNSPTLERDKAVATELAQLLLLDPKIVEMDVNIDLLDNEGIWPSILVHLAEKCVGVMGVQIIPGEMTPDWLTLSRPYYEAPYVLVSRDPQHNALTDLPAGTRLGVPLYTTVDADIMLAIAAGTLDGVRRLPYDRAELMMTLIDEGALDAAIVWKPQLDRLALDVAGFHVHDAALAPLERDSRAMAVLLRTQDQMLRTMLDQAIAALPAQGS
ncbi:substrate-binding periplasmic protein [Pelagibacterium sp.]|uniref:substrate-binding periplasmic protein n=1 Tax=Pelagibacterium sp. TaxID=1967288 RepID=UPI003A949693